MQILTLVFILDVAGMADWHYLRKFSLTSSQAHKSFILAFPDYRTNESWVAVGRYLYVLYNVLGAKKFRVCQLVELISQEVYIGFQS